MGTNQILTEVRFYSEADQSKNSGRFTCPLCAIDVRFERAYWPGVPNIPTAVRSHFVDCAKAMRDEMLHFVVRKLDGRRRSAWFVLDLGVPANELAKTPEEALRSATFNETYKWVGRAALTASGLPLQFLGAIEEVYPDIQEHDGYPLYFKFTCGVELCVIEKPGDTPQNLAAKLLTKLRRLPLAAA